MQDIPHPSRPHRARAGSRNVQGGYLETGGACPKLGWGRTGFGRTVLQSGEKLKGVNTIVVLKAMENALMGFNCDSLFVPKPNCPPLLVAASFHRPPVSNQG